MRTEEDHEPALDPAFEPAPERRPGVELARAREGAGIGLREMAATLHLPESQVRALEDDDYDRLPPPTFVRGYLRSYARVVGLDDDEIVAAYDALGAASEDPDLHLSSGQAQTSNRGLALALVALALVAGVSMGAWWWQARAPVPGNESGPAARAEDQSAAGDADTAAVFTDDDASSADADDAELASATASEPAESGAATMEEGATRSAAAGGSSGASADDTGSDGGAAAAGESAATPEPESGQAADPSTASMPSEQDAEARTAALAAAPSGADATAAAGGTDDTTPDAADGRVGDTTAPATSGPYDPPTQTASATAASAPEAAEGPEMLYVGVDGRSWIEIYDARGRELVYTLYSGSEPLRLRGWAPFDVFLGNSPAVTIRLNGSGVEKSAFTRSDRTARFLVDDDGARRR